MPSLDNLKWIFVLLDDTYLQSFEVNFDLMKLRKLTSRRSNDHDGRIWDILRGERAGVWFAKLVVPQQNDDFEEVFAEIGRSLDTAYENWIILLVEEHLCGP